MSELKKLTDRAIKFRTQRDWKQFHNPKDCAISLSLEAAEVLEHFQWRSDEEVKAYILEHKGDIAEELADVLYWILLMAHDLEIDLTDAYEKKMEKNAIKYPVEKSKGKHIKYDKL